MLRITSLSENLVEKMSFNYSKTFLENSKRIIEGISIEEIERVAQSILEIKLRKGRIFFAGSGGGAGHSSHAAADFRKIAGLECYCISDNISELTARINDNSWSSSYSDWLKTSNFNDRDGLFVMSVGGGSIEKKISENLVEASKYAINVGASIIGIVGRDGGFLRTVAISSILIPTVSEASVTMQVEGFQALLWHLLVSHPILSPSSPKWESLS